MQITGSTQLSGSASAYSRAPVFVFGRYPQMHGDSGPAALDNLAVMGVAQTRGYNGADPAFTDATGTDNLTLQAGTPVYNQPGSGAYITGVKTDGTSYFKGTSGPTLGTKDLVVALAMKWVYSASDQVFLATRSVAAATGVQLYSTGATQTAVLYLNDGTDAVFIEGPALVSGQDVLLVATVNRGEDSTYGAYAFVNSIAGSGVNAISVAQSIVDGSPLSLFALGDGVGDCAAGTVIYGAWVWEAADIFSAGATGAAEMQALASELTQRYFGVYPQKAEAGDYTMTITRASPRYSQVGSVIYALSNGGQCMEMDADGEQYLGVYAESTNLLINSSGLDSWIAVGRVTITPNALIGPFGDLTADLLTETATSGTHYVAQTWTAAALTAYECVLVLQGISADRILSFLLAYDGGSASANVDPLTNTVTSQSNCTVTAGTLGDFCEIRIQTTSPATATGAYLALFIYDTVTSNADYLGDGSDGFYVAHAQICAGAYRHPYIRTAGDTATKAAEVVDIDAGNIPSTNGTLVCEFRVSTSTVSTYAPLFCMTDAGSANYILSYIDTSGQMVTAVYPSGGSAGDVTIAGDLRDYEWHRLVVAWKSGKLFVKVDDTSGTDTSVDLPTGMTQFMLGRNAVPYYLNGHLRNLLVYDEYYENA